MLRRDSLTSTYYLYTATSEWRQISNVAAESIIEYERATIAANALFNAVQGLEVTKEAAELYVEEFKKLCAQRIEAYKEVCRQRNAIWIAYSGMGLN
jgi:hypothetical protein